MKRTKICTYGLALAVATISITGCGGGGGSDPVPQVIINPKLTVEKYPVSGTLKETDGFAMPGTVTLLAFSNYGTTNQKSVTLYSDKTGGTEVTSIIVADDGLVSFFVDSGAALPVTILASGTTSVPNHIGSSAKFTIDKIGTTSFAINIIDRDFPADGVTAVPGVESALGDKDDLPTDLTMSVPSSTLVTIPTGTAFTTSAGAPLKGTVKALLTTFGSSTATASNPIIPATAFVGDPENGVYATLNESDLENFPGGLNNPNTPDTGYFVTAGFVAVDVIDANGKVAKNVSNTNGQFTIRMNIPAGTLDPDTDLALAAGDTIPVYTYDTTNLAWKLDSPASGKIQADANGQLFVDHTTNHFSFWNLGWLVKNTATKINSCTATLNMAKDAITLPLNLKATFTKAGKNTLLTGTKPAGDASITLQNVPNQNIDVVLTDTAKKVIWTTLKGGVNFCTLATPLIASYTAPGSNKPLPVTVTVSEYCKQDPTVTQIVPSTTIIVTTSQANKPGAIPATVYKTIATGTTGISGTYLFNLVPGQYNLSALDRRTRSNFPLLPSVNSISVTGTTAMSAKVEIPVACKPLPTGSTGGSWSF